MVIPTIVTYNLKIRWYFYNTTDLEDFMLHPSCITKASVGRMSYSQDNLRTWNSALYSGEMLVKKHKAIEIIKLEAKLYLKIHNHHDNINNYT